MVARSMRAAFLVPTLERSGGIQAVVGQVRLLRARSDIDVALVVCGPGGGEAGASASADVPVIGFAAASSREWDVAVATWWTTWAAAVELSARRRVLVLQGLDERFYRLVGDLDAPGMAALYRESDVLLKLSRTEGLGLPPLEAAAVGTPSVVTPYGGHPDWLRHGGNGVQVGFDDLDGTAAWLDLLARECA